MSDAGEALRGPSSFCGRKALLCVNVGEKGSLGLPGAGVSWGAGGWDALDRAGGIAGPRGPRKGVLAVGRAALLR